MKILILVQSCIEKPYGDFFDAQQDTWGINDNDIEVIYFFGGNYELYIKELQLLVCDCSPKYDMQHWKGKLAIDFIWPLEWDLLFVTTASSYINKPLLLEVAKKLPLEKCYAGKRLTEAKDFVSGAGIFLSRDTADILRKQTTSEPHYAADVLLGDIMAANNIPIINMDERCDWGGTDRRLTWHYRFKTSDRQADIRNMYTVHELITHNYLK